MAKEPKSNTRHRPLQLIHTFEGLINGMDAIEVMAGYGRPRAYELDNFEKRVRVELKKIVERGVGGIMVNMAHDGYLESEDAWKRFLSGLEIAVKQGLRIWLYDENGYPSGGAGGLVLDGHPELEAKGIKMMTLEQPDALIPVSLPEAGAELFAAFGISPDGKRIKLSAQKGASEIKLPGGDFARVEVYFTAPLYEGTRLSNPDASCRRYINVLDKRAVNRFISLTHLNYFKRIPAHLWKHVEAIFADEPSLVAQVWFPGDNILASVPWCEGLEERFYQDNGYFIEDCVWSLFAGQSQEDKRRRRDYWATVAKMYEEAFSVQISDACSAIDLQFTGHLFTEQNLWGQAVMEGNSISLLEHFQLPGIDFLSCEPENMLDGYLVGIKMVMAAALFGGRKRMTVELSEYYQYWTPERIQKLQDSGDYWEGPRNANSLEDIKYTISFLFMMGIRDYGFYFPWRSFSTEEYRTLCDYAALLCEHSEDSVYQPDCALYWPYETIREEYIPSEKHVHREGLATQSDRFRNISDGITDTCKELFLAGIQFIPVDHLHLHKLPELKIKLLLYPPGQEPTEEATAFCKRAGIEIAQFHAGESSAINEKLPASDIHADDGVLCARYDQFTFVLNSNRRKTSFTITEPADAFFPFQVGERRKVSGKVELQPFECAFLYPQVQC